MSKTLNKVTLIGRVGKDPDVKQLTGTSVANFSIATSESWKDKTTGELKEKTDWHNITAWGKLAEIVGQYVKKGSLLYVEGSLHTDKYEKEGQTHYSTKITAEEVIFLDSKRSDGPAERTEVGPDDKSISELPF